MFIRLGMEIFVGLVWAFFSVAVVCDLVVTLSAVLSLLAAVCICLSVASVQGGGDAVFIMDACGDSFAFASSGWVSLLPHCDVSTSCDGLLCSSLSSVL